MTDADAFLDAIWAAPDDDTPRLVYADWLEEHGYPDYAQFIRLSIRIDRKEVMYPEKRKQLRRERHTLGREIVKRYPEAANLIEFCNPPSGIPREWATCTALALIESWQEWWPFHRPRHLILTDVNGLEAELAGCEYLRRVVTLECEGHVASGWGHRREDAAWEPATGDLLIWLANSPHLDRLKALKIGPLRVTAAELGEFSRSAMAQNLEDLHLWVQFSDGTREDIRAEAGHVPIAITEFLITYADRLPTRIT